MRTGRPIKYDPAHCDAMREHLAAGRTISAFAALLGIERRTLYNWMIAHPEFAMACATTRQDNEPVPGVTLRKPTAAIFSLSAWNMPADLAHLPTWSTMTEDEVDDRLYGQQMRARAA